MVQRTARCCTLRPCGHPRGCERTHPKLSSNLDTPMALMIMRVRRNSTFSGNFWHVELACTPAGACQLIGQCMASRFQEVLVFRASGQHVILSNRACNVASAKTCPADAFMLNCNLTAVPFWHCCGLPVQSRPLQATAMPKKDSSDCIPAASRAFLIAIDHHCTPLGVHS